MFGIFGHPDAAAITALGLHALQHRGQEAAGIVSFDGKRFHSERRLGLVGDTFSRREVIDRLPGNAAVGHVRYSTTGETILRNVQPLFAELEGRRLRRRPQRQSHQRPRRCARQLVREGAMMQSTTDTEVILHLVARARRNRFVDRFIEGLRQLEGAYAFVGLTNKKLVGARDPLGIRPLVIGELDGCPILASETCALDIIGAQYVRDVENGEVVVFDEDGAQSHKPFPPMPARPASSNTSISRGRIRSSAAAASTMCARPWAPNSRARRRPPPMWSCRCRIPACRRRSALPRSPASPTSSASSAITMSAAPSSSRRSRSATRACGSSTRQPRGGRRQAHRAGRRFHRARHHLVKIVQMMRDAGAKEVHFRIASPPITHPDYYGIDTPERDKLLAATHDLEEHAPIHRRRFAGLPVGRRHLPRHGLPGRDPVRPQFTDHCFTGEYPTALTDLTAQDASPRQLSLLAEAELRLTS